MKSFQSKIAVITGAASGIGQQLSIQLAGLGAFCVLADINEAGLRQTLEAIQAAGGQGSTHKVDVSDKVQVHALADEVVHRHGNVDIVINNAGVALGLITIEDLTYEEIEWLLGINLWGIIYGTKAFIPHLKMRPEAVLVNISSVFGLAGFRGQAPYCISKFGIRGFTESLQAEMISYPQLNVMLVHPGGVKTNIARNARHRAITAEQKKGYAEQFDRLARTSSESAARQIIRAIRRKRSRVRIGRDAVMMDRMVRLMPAASIRLFARVVQRMDEKRNKS